MKPALLEAARAHCPVCCGDLESELVYCARCSTPHHDECWQFTGRCAIYACTCEQFTRSEGGAPAGEAAAEEPLIVDGESDPEPVRRPPPPPTPSRPGRPPARPTQRHVPAVVEENPVVELAQSKRAAFRTWLRDLLDEGLRIPRLWTSAPVVQKRMHLPEREHEVVSANQTRVLALVLLAFLPFILLLVLMGNPSWWVAFELACYLGMTWFLYHVVAQPVRRQLLVDSNQEVVLAVSGDPLSVPRRKLANLRGLAAVALLGERDPRSGLEPGVVLLDFEKRPIALPGLELVDTRLGALPSDEDVRRARGAARFLGLTFVGVVDAKGRRRRLPASDGTAPGSS